MVEMIVVVPVVKQGGLSRVVKQLALQHEAMAGKKPLFLDFENPVRKS